MYRTFTVLERWAFLTYWLVYRVVRELPADLVTLAHKGTKVYCDTFELIHRREAAGPNAIWQADHTPLRSAAEWRGSSFAAGVYGH